MYIQFAWLTSPQSQKIPRTEKNGQKNAVFYHLMMNFSGAGRLQDNKYQGKLLIIA